MGAEPYCYVTKYQPDLKEVLYLLRAEEFAAGRYEPCFETRTGKSLYEHQLAPRHGFPSPGACHDSMESMYGEMDESGTKSILDIIEVIPPSAADSGDPDSFDRMDGSNTASPLGETDLNALFGTGKPTSEQVLTTLLATGRSEPKNIDQIKARDSFWERIGRGHARYVILFRDGEPDEVFFAGYSFD